MVPHEEDRILVNDSVKLRLAKQFGDRIRPGSVLLSGRRSPLFSQQKHGREADDDEQL